MGNAGQDILADKFLVHAAEMKGGEGVVAQLAIAGEDHAPVPKFLEVLLLHLKHWQMGEGVLERVADLAAGWDLGMVTFGGEGGGLFLAFFWRQRSFSWAAGMVRLASFQMDMAVCAM